MFMRINVGCKIDHRVAGQRQHENEERKPRVNVIPMETEQKYYPSKELTCEESI